MTECRRIARKAMSFANEKEVAVTCVRKCRRSFLMTKHSDAAASEGVPRWHAVRRLTVKRNRDRCGGTSRRGGMKVKHASNDLKQQYADAGLSHDR